MHPTVEKGRVKTGMFASNEADGFNGYFFLHINSERIKVIASDGLGWQHVSVSKDGSYKPPNWSIMCQVKDLFWTEDQWVVQFHPAKSEYVNNHPGCLHLWRPTDKEMPTPPSILTGWKEKSAEEIAAMTTGERTEIYIKRESPSKNC